MDSFWFLVGWIVGFPLGCLWWHWRPGGEGRIVGEKEGCYWTCYVGPIGRKDLRVGADQPMRDAVRDGFEHVAGRAPKVLESGWGNSEIAGLNRSRDGWKADAEREALNAEHAKAKLAALRDEVQTLRARFGASRDREDMASEIRRLREALEQIQQMCIGVPGPDQRFYRIANTALDAGQQSDGGSD